jgi:peptidyl-prolyl cis-trans isomerase C
MRRELMAIRRIFGAALVLALAAYPMALAAQEDRVVARVNGEEIRQSDVMAMARTLPPQYQSQLMQIYPLLVQRLVDFKLAGKAGRTAGLADDDKVKAFVAKAEEQAIREVYLEREIEARINDAMVQDAYQAHLAANPPAPEHHARHILLKTEEEAREVIGLLDGGAEFAELAKERSTGPSGPNGGDLGYFTAEQMVPEFSQAAAALEPGQHSTDPTQPRRHGGDARRDRAAAARGARPRGAGGRAQRPARRRGDRDRLRDRRATRRGRGGAGSRPVTVAATG